MKGTAVSALRLPLSGNSQALWFRQRGLEQASVQTSALVLRVYVTEKCTAEQVPTVFEMLSPHLLNGNGITDP